MSKAANKKAYIMPQHSIAKIAYYKKYLTTYLSIIERTNYVKKIYLYDFFAGEGKDINGQECSSIAALNCVKQHFGNANAKIDVAIHFNDSGISVVEEGILKINRVEKIANSINLPKHIQLTFTNSPFNEIAPKIIAKLNTLKNDHKAFCFIDPWGYKEIKPSLLKQFLRNGNTELLLFMPICFMHRFVGKVYKAGPQEFPGGEELQKFLNELYKNDLPNIKNQTDFIQDITKQFKHYLKMNYILEIFIEKEKGQYFALFFFSNHKKGFHKMLEAKWALDEKEGKGFRLKSAPELFPNTDYEDYYDKLLKQLQIQPIMSNQELYDFGLANNHLPKHTNKVLKQLTAQNLIQRISNDGLNVNGYYIDDNHERKITIALTQ